MRKIKRIVNIALIFMTIVMVLCSNLYASSRSLRVPIDLDDGRKEGILRTVAASRESVLDIDDLKTRIRATNKGFMCFGYSALLVKALRQAGEHAVVMSMRDVHFYAHTGKWGDIDIYPEGHNQKEKFIGVEVDEDRYQWKLSELSLVLGDIDALIGNILAKSTITLPLANEFHPDQTLASKQGEEDTQKEQLRLFKQLLAELDPPIIVKMMNMPTLVTTILGLKPAYYAYRTGGAGSEVIEAVITATPSFQERFRAFPEEPNKSRVLYDYEAVKSSIIELNALLKDETTVERVLENLRELTDSDLGREERRIRESVTHFLSKQFPEEPEAFLQEIFDEQGLEAESLHGITPNDSLARGFILGIPLVDAILFCIDVEDLLSPLTIKKEPPATEQKVPGIQYLASNPKVTIEYIIHSYEFVERMQAWDRALEPAYELMERELKISGFQGHFWNGYYMDARSDL